MKQPVWFTGLLHPEFSRMIDVINDWRPCWSKTMRVLPFINVTQVLKLASELRVRPDLQSKGRILFVQWSPTD